MWPSWVVNATGESTSCIMRKAGTHTTSSMDDTIHVYMSNLSLISQILFQLTSFPARRKCLRAAIAHGYLIFAHAPERERHCPLSWWCDHHSHPNCQRVSRPCQWLFFGLLKSDISGTELAFEVVLPLFLVSRWIRSFSGWWSRVAGKNAVYVSCVHLVSVYLYHIDSYILCLIHCRNSNPVVYTPWVLWPMVDGSKCISWSVSKFDAKRSVEWGQEYGCIYRLRWNPCN